MELNNNPKLKAASWIQWELARKLVGLAGLELDKLMKSAKSRDFHPVPLPVNLKAHLVSEIRPFESSNVLGIIPGGGSEATQEAVMYTAHYDHLGIVHNAQGDNIYHGAVDNATGCGILLELARAYASLPGRPRRAVLFAAVTGEEQGLLGSEFLGQHPPLARSRIVLDLNFDAVAPIGDPEEVEVSGAERTTFYPVVKETARSFGVQVRPDAHPENGYYYRSDHFSLARVGIPSFSINEGQKFAGHTSHWGDQQAQDYTAHRYHQPSDEYRSDMDFGGVAKMARFGFALGWKAATQHNVIAWHQGDEFEAARKKSEATRE
jgi:Zn-dependent M28 family amino/carboxypeptidase